MRWQIYGIFFMLFFVLIGCNPEESAEPLNDQNQSNSPLRQVENSSLNEEKQLNNQDIANHLANIASQIPHVNDAHAVVAGPYAVVAIDVDEDLDRSRVGTIKYSVNEALYHDTYGKTAVVVADADGAERIRDISDHIEQGRPIQGTIDELAAIVGRYMPSLPLPHEPQPKNSDQNKENLSEDEEELLENVEDEQSNQQNK